MNKVELLLYYYVLSKVKLQQIHQGPIPMLHSQDHWPLARITLKEYKFYSTCRTFNDPQSFRCTEIFLNGKKRLFIEFFGLNNYFFDLYLRAKASFKQLYPIKKPKLPISKKSTNVFKFKNRILKN